MLTDDGFADALNAAPSDSLLVLEDGVYCLCFVWVLCFCVYVFVSSFIDMVWWCVLVDSLFAQDRKSENKSAMSFSGMVSERQTGLVWACVHVTDSTQYS